MVNQRHETFTIFLRQDVLLLSCTALQINFVSKRVDVRANGSFLVETTHQVLEGKVAAPETTYPSDDRHDIRLINGHLNVIHVWHVDV